MIYGLRGVVSWLIKHLASPCALSAIPSDISHVKHDTTTLIGLKYLLLVLDKSHAITASLSRQLPPVIARHIPNNFGTWWGHVPNN